MKQAFLFSILVSLLCICDATSDLRATVCETSKLNDSKKFCKSTLKSPKCACRTDVNRMGLFVASKIAKAAININQAIISSFNISKNVADSCDDNINDAMDNLMECIGYLNKTEHDYDTFDINADAIYDDFNTCEIGFLEGPSREPVKVKKAIAIAKNLTDVFLVIKNYLKN